MDPFPLAVGTLIIGLPGSLLRRGFINSITGLMTGPGTHWAESLVERFTQVSETRFLKNRNSICNCGTIYFISHNLGITLQALLYKYCTLTDCATGAPILFLIFLFYDTCNFILIADLI